MSQYLPSTKQQTKLAPIKEQSRASSMLRTQMVETKPDKSEIRVNIQPPAYLARNSTPKEQSRCSLFAGCERRLFFLTIATS